MAQLVGELGRWSVDLSSLTIVVIAMQF